jgi:hypothetical protein
MASKASNVPKEEVPATIYTPAIQEIFTASIGKRVTIDNGVDKPFEEVLEYVGQSDVITKHGSKYPFHQVKAAD